MGQPGIHYIAKEQRWVFRGRGGDLRATLDDDGIFRPRAGEIVMGGAASLGQNLNVGSTFTVGGGNAIAKIIAFVGSMPAITAAGSFATGTIDNATGLLANDIVFASPTTLLGWAGVAGAWVPTTNTLNVSVTGSLPALGWSVVAFRRG